MSDAIEIIISAVDSASEVFQSIIASASGMAEGISDVMDQASSDFDTISENVSGFSDAVSNVDTATLEELADELGMSTEEVERLIATGADIGSLSAGFNEASVAADELEKEIQEDVDAMAELGSAGDVMAAQTFMDMATGMKDSMLGMADSAGTFNDSIMRASVEAQGAGISVDEMKTAVSDLSDETGRAGGQIRESFIKATARGVTDMDSFKTMMKGAGAQATLLGTDIQTMGDKFSSMAQKDTLMARTLAETGITMKELGTAMGMTGATADEVKAKWKELDTNQRAAILGQAASMNEGKTANAEYKTSWAGLSEQLEIAKGRLERIVGSVILPVLVPAMQVASSVLGAVGDALSAIMAGPLGGIVSVIGTLAGAFMIAVTGAAALRTFLGFLKMEMLLDTAATIMNTAAKILNGEASGAAAIGNALLGEGFMASAAGAWAAAAGFWAALAPLLPFIAIGAAIVLVIYEIGKAFGWWTDVGSMLDAIGAGIQRLWSAFINHPDVQAAISMISSALSTLWSWIQQAGQAILEFFGISTGGDFDIVRALIDGIGEAWNNLKEIIMAVWGVIEIIIQGFTSLQTTVTNVWNAIMNILSPYIAIIVNLVMGLMNTFDQFRNGQMDLPAFIMTILTQLWNAYNSILTRISQAMLRFASQMLTRATQAGRNVLNGVINQVRQLPSRALSALLQVVSAIASAGAQWLSAGISQASSFVSGVSSRFGSVVGAISSALSGVVSAITSPFQRAYESVCSIVDNIKSKVSQGLSEAAKLANAGGGDRVSETSGIASVYTESAFDLSDAIDSGETTIVHESEPLEVNENLSVKIDLENVPSDISEDTLIDALTSNNVVSALVNNNTFQKLDSKAKNQLLLKQNRARGV